MNKKSIGGYVRIILTFSMLAMMSIFSIVFIYEIGDSYIIQEIYDATIQVEQDLDVSVALQDHATALRSEYQGINFPYDLFFLFFWISAIVSTIAIALKSRKDSATSFFGGLFISMMGVMLVVFVLDQIQIWFFAELFYPLFSDITLNLPIMTYYFNNLGWITALWFLFLLFINQVEIKANFGGRFEQ